MNGVALKRGDTRAALQATLLDGNGQPVNLTTAAGVRFLMKASGATTAKVARAATIQNAAGGVVWQVWEAVDTDTAGVYQAEFEVTYVDGRVETFPAGDYIPVVILADLG